jgi:hypothetical protein
MNGMRKKRKISETTSSSTSKSSLQLVTKKMSQLSNWGIGAGLVFGVAGAICAGIAAADTFSKNTRLVLSIIGFILIGLAFVILSAYLMALNNKTQRMHVLLSGVGITGYSDAALVATVLA